MSIFERNKTVMFLYVELWKPKPEWDNLSREQRRISGDVGARRPPDEKYLKAELVGFAVCDEDTPMDAAYRYLAVWKMPNLGHVHMLEKAVQEEG